MTKKNIIAGLILLVASSLLIVACSGAPQPAAATATVDANAIYTQAAQTVQAGLAQTQAAQPTEAATATVTPTNTMDPVMAAGLTATSNAVLQPAQTTPVVPGQTPPAAGTTPTSKIPLTATIVKLATATSAVVAAPPAPKGDKAVLVDQLPKDGQTMPRNAGFDMHIFLKNTGTTTWTTAYTLVFYAGDRMGSPQDFNLPNEVKPGETVKLLFSMQAPDSTGNKQTIWSLRNADGTNFYPVYLKLTVTD